MCPFDGDVMRDTHEAYRCPECGYTERVEAATMPPEFDGPSIHGG